jgi:hypothetical protein
MSAEGAILTFDILAASVVGIFSMEVMVPPKPIETDIKNLIDMFEFFLTERHLEKPIEAIGRCVRDLRIIIGRIVVDHFLKLTPKEEERFCEALAQVMTDRCAALPFSTDEDKAYQSYCLEQILVSFEYAAEIKRAYSDDPVLQKILSLDIPILRPFDYGLQGKLKVVEKQKRKKIYS